MVSTGKDIWIGEKNGKVFVHSESGEQIECLEKHSKGVTCMAVSHDGTKVASGDAYRYMQIWDSASRTEIASIGEHKDKINSVCFSSSGEQLLSCTFDFAFGVTEIASKSMKQTKSAHGKKNVTHIC